MRRVSSILVGSSIGLSSSSSSTGAASSLLLAVAVRRHGHEKTGDRSKPLTIHWDIPDKPAPGNKDAPKKDLTYTTRTVTAYDGQTLLEVAQEYELPIEGACAGSCACSTCHVYLENETIFNLFQEPTDEENDMLDLAFFPTSLSRLGCQLKVKRETMDGMRVTLPRATRNMAVDGYVAKPH